MRKSSRWMVVSFYTINTGYEQEVENLKASLREFGIAHRISPCEPTGNWRTNLDYKSAVIRRAFDMFPDRDIVFLDADAVVRSWPVLFDGLSKRREYDISACFYSYRPESGDRDELLSGTLWFQNNETSRALVDRWHHIGLQRPDIRHQMCLKRAIAELQAEGREVRVFRHPFEYTCIFDYRRGRRGDPVIEHFQASRRFRHEVSRRPRIAQKTMITTSGIQIQNAGETRHSPAEQKSGAE